MNSEMVFITTELEEYPIAPFSDSGRQVFQNIVKIIIKWTSSKDHFTTTIYSVTDNKNIHLLKAHLYSTLDTHGWSLVSVLCVHLVHTLVQFSKTYGYGPPEQ